MNSFAVIVVCSLSTMAFGFPMFKDLDHMYKICGENEEDLRMLADKLCAGPTAIVGTMKTSEDHELIMDCCLGKCSGKIIKEHFCPEKKTDTETNDQPRSKRLVDVTDLPFSTPTSTTTMTSTVAEPPTTAELSTTAEPSTEPISTTTVNVPTCYPYSVKTQILDILLRSLPIPIFPLIYTEKFCEVGVKPQK